MQAKQTLTLTAGSQEEVAATTKGSQKNDEEGATKPRRMLAEGINAIEYALIGPSLVVRVRGR
jgi:hypothetical protein